MTFLCWLSCNRLGQKESASSLINQDTSLNSVLDGIVNKEITDPERIFYLLDSISAEARLTANFELLSGILFEEGNQHYIHNHYEEAKDFLNQAVSTAIACNDTLVWAKSLQMMGSLALATGDDNLCLKLNFEALPLFEKLKNKDGLARVYNIIGLYKMSQNETDSAITYFNEAMALNLETGNRQGIIHNKGNLAYLYEVTGKLADAENIYYELLDIMIQTGDSLNLPVIYSDLASLNQKKGKMAEATRFMRKAVYIGERTGDIAGLSGYYGNLGEFYFIENKFDSARSFFEKSIQCSKIIDDPELEMMALQFLIGIDTASGHNKQAISRLPFLLALKDTVFSRENKNHLKVTELDYENKKKSLEIESQQLQLAAEKKQKELYIYLFTLVSTILAMTAFIIYYLLKNHRKKHELLSNQLVISDLQLENSIKNEEIQKLEIEKYENSLKIKELEQVSQALALEQKNDLLNLIYSKIKTSINDSGTLSIEQLHGIVISIRTQISGKDEADLFNQKFNQVHPDFYNKLIKAHPGLTKSELKFCAYLRLNLTSHQISNIMNVTNEAIRKNRHRIRKKLELSTDVSLENYLSTF